MENLLEIFNNIISQDPEKVALANEQYCSIPQTYEVIQICLQILQSPFDTHGKGFSLRSP